MNSWKSNAKYSQEPEEGSIFELKDNNLRISIHHYIGCGNVWFLSCHGLNVSQHCLDTEDFDVAVERAKVYLKKVVQSVEKNFYSFYTEKGNERVRY